MVELVEERPESDERMDEIWVEVGIGAYEVSNFGRIVNGATGRDLKPSPDKNGYYRVALHYGGKRHDVFVHRLVARAFFLNYKQGVEVKHINEDKADNSVLNLTLGAGCRKAVNGRL
jgi:hypothetical protein